MTTQRIAPITRRILVAGFALLAPTAILASACTASNEPGTEESPSERSSESLPVEPTSAPEDITDPEEAAIAAYLRYRQAFAEASAIPNPEHPALTAAATDQALTLTQEAVQRLVDDGLRTEGAPTSEVEVKESALDADPVQVVVVDCSDSTPWTVLVADTGEAAPDEEYGRRSIDAMVELRDGAWLVTEVVVRSIGSC